MKPSLREILAESHISAVALAVLIIWSMDSGFQALWEPVSTAITFAFRAIAVLDVSFFSVRLASEHRLNMTLTFLYLFHLLISLAAAWILSLWVYGVGPLSALGTYRDRLARSNNV